MIAVYSLKQTARIKAVRQWNAEFLHVRAVERTVAIVC
jgi:hypothetical protein